MNIKAHKLPQLSVGKSEQATPTSLFRVQWPASHRRTSETIFPRISRLISPVGSPALSLASTAFPIDGALGSTRVVLLISMYVVVFALIFI